jgi:hypothetical protein
MQLRTILVAIDASPQAAESRRWRVSLAQKSRARPLLWHILATAGEGTSPFESMLIPSAPAIHDRSPAPRSVRAGAQPLYRVLVGLQLCLQRAGSLSQMDYFALAFGQALL